MRHEDYEPTRAIRAVVTLSLAVMLGSASITSEAAESPDAEDSNRPNVLFVLADDMGFSDLGCYGGEIETPNIDSLANNGLRFTQFYNTGRCWPSRACLMTGHYARALGVDPGKKGPKPRWVRFLPHYLKPAGYRCYHSGKWHVSGYNNPIEVGGFDHSYRSRGWDRFFSPKEHWLDEQRVAQPSKDSGYYATREFAGRAIGFLKDHKKQHADKPFFLYLAFIAPHFPLHALPDDIERYRDRYLRGWDAVRQGRLKRMREMGIVEAELSPRDDSLRPYWNLSEEQLRKRIGAGEIGRAVAWNSLTEEQKRFQATKMAIHAAMVYRVDQEVGRVVGQLEKMGELENTIIMVASDNGASAEQIIRGDGHDKTATPGSANSYLCLGPGWSTASNTPFRKHKHWTHEGGIATPLVVHWPQGIKAKGQLRRAVGHFIDIVPTVLEAVGIEPSVAYGGAPEAELPGRSLLPAFAAELPIDRELLYFDHSGNLALRMGNWKLVSSSNGKSWELYDLGRDRSECHDLAADQPQRLESMRKRFETYRRELDEMFSRGGQ